MARILWILTTAAALGTSGLAASPGAPVGLLSKVIAEVSRKEADREWQKAKRGETLGAGDRVRTGEKSVAIIKFLDNSLVRVRELTEVTVRGAMNGPSFSKSVEVHMGVIGFTVQKQRSGEEFRFSSPTSVASIRGTGGMFRSRGTGDTLIVLEGAVEFTNVSSTQLVTVAAGFTGLSFPDGTILTRPSTNDERRSAEDALRGEAQKTLEFELRDNQGRTKQLHIEYRD
ncbi:MAG TPA: FecR family protein [Chloroflexota bacterium]